MITISDKDGVLGTVELQDGQLTGSTASMQRLADQALDQHGSPEAAYDALSRLNNGYAWASTDAGQARNISSQMT
jgi:hypothetical protein